MMKTFILILFSAIIYAGPIKSQTVKVSYDYDKAGNRTKREMVTVTLQSAPATGNELKSAKQDEKPVEDQTGDFRVLVYPNPTKGNLDIEVSGGDEQNTYSYSLFNASGAKLLDGNFKGPARQPVAMAGLTNGIYFLKVQYADKTLTFKIIKE
jgi:hypothetical protein